MNFEHHYCNQGEEKNHTSCNKIDKQYFEVEEVYIAGNLCEGVWKIGKNIGEPSATGKIFLACCSEKCKYVLKEVYFSQRSQEQRSMGYLQMTKDKFLNEVYIQKYLAENNLAPDVYQIFLNSEKGAFIMDGMKDTARRAIIDIIDEGVDVREKINGVLTSVYELIERIHNLGIYHGDTHLNNFMRKNETENWLLIDFGMSGFSGSTKDFKHDYVNIYTDLNVLKGEDNNYGVYLDEHIQRLYEKIKSMDEGKKEEDESEDESEEESDEILFLIEKVNERIIQYQTDIEQKKTKNLIDKIGKTIEQLENKIEELQPGGKSLKLLKQYQKKLVELEDEADQL